MKLMYTYLCHSFHCSKMFLKLTMYTIVPHPFQNTAHSFLRSMLSSPFILIKIPLQVTLMVLKKGQTVLHHGASLFSGFYETWMTSLLLYLHTSQSCLSKNFTCIQSTCSLALHQDLRFALVKSNRNVSTIFYIQICQLILLTTLEHLYYFQKMLFLSFLPSCTKTGLNFSRPLLSSANSMKIKFLAPKSYFVL